MPAETVVNFEYLTCKTHTALINNVNISNFVTQYLLTFPDIKPMHNNKLLAKVNSCSCSLYVVVRPSVCHLSVVCRLSVCNVRAPYSAD